jgi:ubiquinone/menaquinone biosynthesis C-methylase UbiE
MPDSRPPLPKRLVALGYDLALRAGPESVYLGPKRRKLVRSLSGLVLEIGAGTGLSLRYFGPGATVIATEPDMASVERLVEKLPGSPATVRVVAADAAGLPFPDAAFDGLVCHLALCTIPDPGTALAEAIRVLKPGAPLRFLEHVRSEGRFWSRAQDVLAPAWSRVAGGCRLNQDTENLLQSAGLPIELVERAGGLLMPVRLIWARAPR